MMIEQDYKQDIRQARKRAKNISDSSWSGDDIAIVNMMIYEQLKRIADALEKRKQ